MVNLLFSKNSLEEVKQNPHLGIGLHLVFDAGRLIFSSDSSLTDRTDFFWKGKHESNQKGRIWNMSWAQLDLFYKWHSNVTYMDSHHHIHLYIPQLMEVVVEGAAKYNLPVRMFPKTKFTDKTGLLFRLLWEKISLQAVI
jgi:chitin disaccharide deacetylase